jgi:hypothetical protein
LVETYVDDILYMIPRGRPACTSRTLEFVKPSPHSALSAAPAP